MKRLILLGLAAGLCVLSATADRTRTCLDEGWRFDLGDSDVAQDVAFDDSGWRRLNVPHDWAIESAFSETNSSRNAWLPGGIGWYRKTFELSPGDQGQTVELQFDGVYKHATVWVNGNEVGTQYDGYTSFYFDVTPYVKFDGPNTLAVRVDNSLQPNCRWYTGSGIYRHVWLTVKDRSHIKNRGTYITTPAITKSEAKVRVVTDVAFRGDRPQDFILETSILNDAGVKVASVQSTQTLGMRNAMEVEQQLSVLSPKLWSVETPRLYTAVSRLRVKGKWVDEVQTSFGIRDLRFDAEKGFFLNDQPMKMKGVCLHAEASTFGAAIPVEVWERRLAGLKSAGCNAIRTAHNPAAPEFMDLCDRMGFLVMDELVDKWDDKTFADPFFHSEWKKNFGETVRRDRNHPSVMIWSVGNENHAPGSTEQTESLERYCDFVRSVDPTRPVVSGMERGVDMDPAKKVDDILRSCEHMDLIGMNYGLQWSKRIALRKPGKAFVSTESLPYFGCTEKERWSHTERHHWFDVVENDSNIGMFIWSGIKYLGEVPAKGLHSWPEIFCWPGSLLDGAGFRTDLSYLYQSLWTDEPVVRIAIYQKGVDYNKKWGAPPTKSMWNYDEGDELELVTYTNCEFVELSLNGRRIGTQKLSDFSNWIMKWYRVAYEPGTLKAVGIRNGKPVCEFKLQTAGKPAAIQLESETLGALTFVEVQLIDAVGAAVRHVDRELTFCVEGGEVLSLDNGALTALDRLRETGHRSTANGRCLAVVKPVGQGPVKLTVQADGLRQTSTSFAAE